MGDRYICLKPFETGFRFYIGFCIEKSGSKMVLKIGSSKHAADEFTTSLVLCRALLFKVTFFCFHFVV